MSVGQWVERTHSKGLIVKAGRYGGTYAHKDIAFHFAMWLSPEFQLLVTKEYQVLKQKEFGRLPWDVRRQLAKVNYRLHTEAVKDYIIPNSKLPQGSEWLEYASEADFLNIVIFGCTAKEWRDCNGLQEPNCDNIRDCANLIDLTILVNLESLNSRLIRDGIPKEGRFELLKKEAAIERKTLETHFHDGKGLESPNKKSHDYDTKLKGLLSVPPPKEKK